ncbi:aminoglycoside 6-adenylyltransferase [Halalkalibacter hemicellulosilyticus]|uniref:Aminoglycoside 6-adenylyltransferase n=1 Tax=Halalkalibacter hemicellulosilyticusJCM 9152 TaxID=1236971 RepID=W4QBJ3_9BACI|nr:aminoglycoside 6-adenylyltransferase [Halalkalibacter hemicellulosilyticus]GAE28769.1 aminoglycoside 6-adenylyltransferase [Halalkalibacter hemicellulosilyticusJCM 9152]
MRTEKTMLETITGYAKNDARIRAVYMNGSRTNPNVPKDIFQDFDIVYVVEETKPFIEDKRWLKVFGEILIMQEPDWLDKGLGRSVDFSSRYAYLMLFTDGNRIDLSLQSIKAMKQVYGQDRLTIPLLDKDNILPSIPPPTDEDYYIQRPSEGQYNSCTNDFWWCLQNVAKGLWRKELPYVKGMFEETIRYRVDCMVNWWIGVHYGYQLSTGKYGKYIKRYLPESYWQLYKKTFSNAEDEMMWESVFVSCDLFRSLARDVGVHFGYVYPEENDHHMMMYLQRVRELPADAEDIL